MNKRIILILLFTFAMMFNVRAGEPFTSSSTGTDWKQASDSYKHKYCKMISEKLQSEKPGITETFLYDSLTNFYDTTDSNVVKQKVTEVIALSVATK